MKGWMKVLIGLVLGAIFGLVFGQEFQPLTLVGKVFIDLLKMLVGLMVFASIVTGICHINDPKKLGRIGLRTILFYLGTTGIAITVGILSALWIAPGRGLDLIYDAASLQEARRIGILEFISSVVPANPFAAFVEGNILQVIVFSVLFAFAIIFAGEKGKGVLGFCESLSEVMQSMTHFIMRTAPFGVFALIASSVGSIGFRVILPLLKFLLCNYIACLFQIVVIFSLLLKLLAKTPVMPFFKGMKDAIVLAFTTSSSAATLPVSLECATEELGISEDIAGFVLSLGSTINMNGAAIGQAISCLFIAEAYGITLSWFNMAVLVVTALICAIGAAGIPGQGIVMLSVVLGAMGLPLEGIALVAGVDRLREMVSAVVNILGDAVGAMYVARKENAINLNTYQDANWLESSV